MRPFEGLASYGKRGTVVRQRSIPASYSGQWSMCPQISPIPTIAEIKVSFVAAFGIFQTVIESSKDILTSGDFLTSYFALEDGANLCY